MLIALFALNFELLSLRAASTKICVEQANQILNSSEMQKTQTQRLAAYLSQLVEGHVIGDAELFRFLENLKRDRVINPIHDEVAEVESKQMIHRDGVENIIRLGGFNLRLLEEWTRRTLENRGDVKVKRDETRRKTQDTHKIEFVPIQPGRFQMGEEGKKVDVTLTHPFEVMSTLVTQKQWVDLMGKNPSKFVRGEHAVTVTVNENPVSMQPNNPVEQVTWWSVLVYANKLSEKNGLPLAYDLSQLVFKSGTRAEDGTLDIERGELKINAPNGNIYEAQGFRLPTEAEQEYLMRAGGKANGAYHFGDDEADLADHAWYWDNANRKTHPVGELKPVMINGKAVYDLLGNVCEWVQDWYMELSSRSTIDPKGPESGELVVRRGGSWGYDSRALRAYWRSPVHPNSRRDDVGFRLVRRMRDENK